MTRLSVKKVGSFLGNCLIITDKETGNNVEVMAAQLKGIMSASKSTGELPHAGWQKSTDKTDEEITIYHDDNRENHTVTFTLSELAEALS